MFELDPRLAADTAPIGDLALCRVLWMDDARFPWIILVPRRVGAREVHELSASDRLALWDEVDRATRALVAIHAPDKINVAALGNVVPQLHVHVVGRYARDSAWPGPVWGSGARVPYAPDARDRVVETIATALGLDRSTGGSPRP